MTDKSNGSLPKIKRKTKTYESNSAGMASNSNSDGSGSFNKKAETNDERAQPYQVMDINELDGQIESGKIANRKQTGGQPLTKNKASHSTRLAGGQGINASFQIESTSKN
jgi:hypothetical protein